MTKAFKKVVVKIGSSVIAPFGKLDLKLISKIVKDILVAEKKGYKVILVSSGAIACGLNKLKLAKRPKDTHLLMAISSLGQIILMDVFNAKFKKYKRTCAQILLTWDDFSIRKRFINIRTTINKLLDMDIISIINENDVISYEEIRFGDNDRISALVADLVGADKLIMLSDVEGLLRGKQLVREVTKIDSEILALAKKEDKVHTSGGMFTKLQAAKIAISSGTAAVIASGHKEKVILNAVEGKNPGTLFLASSEKHKARKRWIAYSIKVKGKIYIDDGAKEALLNKGKSLLGVGITKAEGDFKKNDAVEISDSQGIIIGRGLINYNCEDLKDIKQKKFMREVIHRDNFVKLFEG